MKYLAIVTAIMREKGGGTANLSVPGHEIIQVPLSTFNNNFISRNSYWIIEKINDQYVAETPQFNSLCLLLNEKQEEIAELTKLLNDFNDNLPELTDEERTAMNALPDDFAKHLWIGERWDFETKEWKQRLD